MKNLAVIPARSGSKGLENKNIREINGKPLLSYTVEAALKSGMFECVHISTDTELYAKIGRESGGETPFLRSEELAADDVGSWDVVKWVLQQYEKRGQAFDTVALLQPTSPLRDEHDIRKAYELYDSKRAKMIISVCEMDHSPLWSNVLPENLSMTDFEDVKLTQTPRQQLPVYYRMNGAIYLADTKHLFREKDIYTKDSFAYIMGKESSVDIDDEIDFILAETIINRRNQK